MNIDPEILRGAADAADAAGVAPGPWGIVAKIVGAALRLAETFVRDGKNPLDEIERIHAATRIGTEDAWTKARRERFGGGDVG